jgi:hypothetical protein
LVILAQSLIRLSVYPDLLKKKPPTLRDEFGNRLITAMRASTASEQIKQDLAKIASVLRIEIKEPANPDEQKA